MFNTNAAPSADILAVPPVCDEVEATLVPIFLEEADELLPQMNAVLLAWQAHPDDLQQSVALKRLLHSFKGGARMVGALRIGGFAHQIENRLQFFAQNRNQLGDWDSLSADFEQLSALIAPLRATQNPSVRGEIGNSERVHFGSLHQRLARVVQQTAASVGKSAQFELVGGEMPLNRTLASKISAPLEHLLRNAIVHGIELPAERLRLDKSADGFIRLSLRVENAEYIIELSDDGAGLNFEEIYKKSNINNELNNSAEFAFEQAVQLIFTPGFSTADEITEIAGRGIGLAAVQSEVSALGGRIQVTSQTGFGTQFALYLPVQMA